MQRMCGAGASYMAAATVPRPLSRLSAGSVPSAGAERARARSIRSLQPTPPPPAVQPVRVGFGTGELKSADLSGKPGREGLDTLEFSLKLGGASEALRKLRFGAKAGRRSTLSPAVLFALRRRMVMKRARSGCLRPDTTPCQNDVKAPGLSCLLKRGVTIGVAGRRWVTSHWHTQALLMSR